jgi:hypothetical protein
VRQSAADPRLCLGSRVDGRAWNGSPGRKKAFLDRGSISGTIASSSNLWETVAS